jgi:UDPglucose--hexose-1-phosphate uridylyltransferase
MSERRLDPTTREWTTFASPARGTDAEACALCAASAELADGDILVLDDLVPPLQPAPPAPRTPSRSLFPVAAAVGAAEAVLHSSDHGLTLDLLGPQRLEQVVDVWARRYAELGDRDESSYVHVCADEDGRRHSHSRILAFPDIPPRPRRKLDVAGAHLAETGACVLCEVAARERADGVRVLSANASFVAYVPFAARVSHEVHVVANRHATSLLDLSDRERTALAQVLHAVLAGYRSLWGGGFAYRLSLHQAPVDESPWLPVSHFHIELVPSSQAESDAGSYVNRSSPEGDAADLRQHVRL